MGLRRNLWLERLGPDYIASALTRAHRELAALNLDIYVTELDVNDRELPAAIGERDRAVAAVYGAFLAAILPEPRLKLITSWGLSDRTTWLNGFFPRADGLPQRPLPCNENNQPKPATASIQTALNKR
ncbi:MAG: endo-1,4-beta-xylanase [Cyanobium sp. CZS 25K]|nr:endo-1,4-beta-xylanase [Cyanobium sp. CZS25K]